MAYWYTYPLSPTSSDSDVEEEYHLSADKLQKIFDAERDFFEDIGSHPQFYAFHEKDYLAWQMEMDHPYYMTYAMNHFAYLVDHDTMDLIRKGISEYKHTSVHGIPYGDLHYDKDTLSFLFQKATEWVEFKELDRAVNVDEYINNVCWVVAQLIQFQKSHN